MRTIELTDEEALALDAIVGKTTVGQLFFSMGDAGFTVPEVRDVFATMRDKILLTNGERAQCRQHQQGH